jgi:hypothetical protein
LIIACTTGERVGTNSTDKGVMAGDAVETVCRRVTAEIVAEPRPDDTSDEGELVSFRIAPGREAGCEIDENPSV